MTVTKAQSEIGYFNAFENGTYQEGKPVIEPLLDDPAVQLRRVALSAGTELKCHKTEHAVLVVWLRGKACFIADGQEFIM